MYTWYICGCGICRFEPENTNVRLELIIATKLRFLRGMYVRTENLTNFRELESIYLLF